MNDKMGLLILSKLKKEHGIEDEEEESKSESDKEGGSDEALQACAKDLLMAIKSDNSFKLAQTLKHVFQILSCETDDDEEKEGEDEWPS